MQSLAQIDSLVNGVGSVKQGLNSSLPCAGTRGRAVLAKVSEIFASMPVHEQLESQLTAFLQYRLNRKNDDLSAKSLLQKINRSLAQVLMSWANEMQFFASTENLSDFFEVGKKIFRYHFGHSVMYTFVDIVENLTYYKRSLVINPEAVKSPCAAIVADVGRDLYHGKKEFAFAAKAMVAVIRFSNVQARDVDGCIQTLQCGLQSLTISPATFRVEDKGGPTQSRHFQAGECLLSFFSTLPSSTICRRFGNDDKWPSCSNVDGNNLGCCIVHKLIWTTRKPMCKWCT